MADVKAWVQGTKDYVNDLRQEMRRVTWPNRQQVEGTTAVVLSTCLRFGQVTRFISSRSVVVFLFLVEE